MNKTHQRMTLLATSISYVLVILDTSIVNVALENISRDLGTDVTGLQWIVAAYVIIFASLVLSGGALGDTFGARKIYMIGLVLFTMASLISGCAPSLSVLIAGRILQGVGASLLVPCALSLIAHAYLDNIARAKAIASWASWGGVALVLGPLVGGLLLSVFDWRSIFFLNVPICLGGIWLTLKIDGQTGDHGSRRLDLPGQLSAAFAMILLIATLIEGREFGWSNGWLLAAIALSVLSALSFVIIERKSKSPMLPVFLFSKSGLFVGFLRCPVRFSGLFWHVVRVEPLFSAGRWVYALANRYRDDAARTSCHDGKSRIREARAHDQSNEPDARGCSIPTDRLRRDCLGEHWLLLSADRIAIATGRTRRWSQ
jgi:DHA2 family methylenomycin A resistance protein-like MFS transporter